MPPPPRRPLYEEVLFERLRIPRGIYEDEEHLKAIHEKLITAAGAMRAGLTEFVSLNVCIHIASSAVLLGSKPIQLKSTLDELGNDFPRIDPTTVVTAASLYYMIKTLRSQDDLAESERTSLEYLRKRFEEIGWLVGAERMRKLEFD